MALRAVSTTAASLIALLALLCSARQGAGQCATDTVELIAAHLGVRYEVVRNLPGDPIMRMSWTNGGAANIEDGAWAVYLTHSPIDPRNIFPNGTLLGNSGLRVHHVNGALNRIEPTPAFAPLPPGQTLDIEFVCGEAQAARYYIMPNWYVVSTDPACEDASVIESTVGEALDWVEDFTRPDQWKRSSWDLYNPYTPAERYALDDVENRGPLPPRSIVPRPAEEFWDPLRNLDLGDEGWVIVQPVGELLFDAEYLAEALGLPIVPVTPPRRYISLRLSDPDSWPPRPTETEAYLLTIDADFEVVAIMSIASHGVFYGIQTLLSLSESGQGRLAHGAVRDEPRFEWRGMHVDVSRNFHSGPTEIRRLLDVMARYKLNKLHFHLADDEGWRLEIPEIPELTEVGSNRCHDLTGDRCIIPQFGSSPNIPNSGTGYYTVEEFREILQYAQSRHIEVIPEFEMPGHAHAAINAMLARQRKYAATDPERANEFLLSDPEDTSAYLSIQGYTDNGINPCIESTYHFVDTLIRSVKDIYRQAGIRKLDIFHMGGDEVPRNAWTQSPACTALGLNPTELMDHFIRRVASLAAEEGVGLAAWEDAFYSGGAPVDRDSMEGERIYATVWDNVWEWGTGNRAYVLANSGYKVILAHATHLYFDMPQEPDPEERGQYWATRLTPIRKIFSFMPDDIYLNMGVDGSGYPLDPAQICRDYGCPPLDADKRANVVGMQGQLWAEQVRTSAQFEYMIFPRLVALAERAWHRAAWEGLQDPAAREQARNEDWTRFANILGHQELARLDRVGIQYRVPLPGVRVSAGNLMEVSSGFPGLPAFYSLDGGATWLPYSAPTLLPPASGVLVVIRSADGLRSSRPVFVISNP